MQVDWVIPKDIKKKRTSIVVPLKHGGQVRVYVPAKHRAAHTTH